MIITFSRNAVPIRLTRERWQHIKRRHPEMQRQRAKVLETISTPDMILRGDFGELLAARLYSRTPLTRKYLIAAHKELSAQDGFVITTYLTNALSRRRKVLWKR